MRLMDFIRPDAVLPDLKAATPRDTIDEMVGALVKARAIPASERRKVVDALLRREKKGTTGFGNSVAIPHSKQEGVSGAVSGLRIVVAILELKELLQNRSTLVGLRASPSDCG